MIFSMFAGHHISAHSIGKAHVNSKSVAKFHGADFEFPKLFYLTCGAVDRLGK